jgi:hypothetical protein
MIRFAVFFRTMSKHVNYLRSPKLWLTRTGQMSSANRIFNG